jgi:hypothetical protein
MQKPYLMFPTPPEMILHARMQKPLANAKQSRVQSASQMFSPDTPAPAYNTLPVPTPILLVGVSQHTAPRPLAHIICTCPPAHAPRIHSPPQAYQHPPVHSHPRSTPALPFSHARQFKHIHRSVCPIGPPARPPVHSDSPHCAQPRVTHIHHSLTCSGLPRRSGCAHGPVCSLPLVHTHQFTHTLFHSHPPEMLTPSAHSQQRFPHTNRIIHSRWFASIRQSPRTEGGSDRFWVRIHAERVSSGLGSTFILSICDRQLSC